MNDRTHTTELLNRASDGDTTALRELLPLLYDELRELANKHLHKERPNHTLQPTEILHELYFKIVDLKEIQWQGRAHFFAMASRTIRRILIDHARARDAKRRGGKLQKVSLDGLEIEGGQKGVDILALDEVLDDFAQEFPREAKLVELRFYGGLKIKEAAEVLQISERTAANDWVLAKAWLARELKRRG